MPHTLCTSGCAVGRVENAEPLDTDRRLFSLLSHFYFHSVFEFLHFSCFFLSSAVLYIYHSTPYEGGCGRMIATITVGAIELIFVLWSF